MTDPHRSKKMNSKMTSFITKTSRWIEKLRVSDANTIAIKYSYMSIDEHRRFVEELLSKAGVRISGDALELGAGVGVLSASVVSIFDDINSINVTDIVPDLFDLQQKVLDTIVRPIEIKTSIQNFNHTSFNSGAFDYILEFDAFHHSDDFAQTIKESSRILKVGGQLICFDRAHSDSFTKEQEEYLLNIEYSSQYKKEHNIKEGDPWTRADNGEHEIRISEFKNQLEKNGFECQVFIFQRKSLKALITILVGLLPFSLRRSLDIGCRLSFHWPMLAHYIPFLGTNFGGINKVFDLSFQGESEGSPRGKMLIVAKKIR